MPLYEYQCEQCKEVKEVLQNASEPPLTTCDTCGGTLHKNVGGGTFHLYGNGFYTTDNKRKYLK
jgi:putative FmdB family regulatory protein